MAKEKSAKQNNARALALVGDETLLGRELKEVMQARGPEFAVEAFAANGEGNFAEREGETVYIRPVDADSVKEMYAVILAGLEEGSRKAYATALAIDHRPALIDGTGFLAHQEEARLVAPLFEEPKKISGDWLFVLAHPAAAAIALVMTRLAKHRPIKTAVVHVFEPASERGKRGLTELHQQTTSLLNFKPLDKDVFDAQLAFNMLPAYGEDAPFPLAPIEARLAHETALLLARRANGVAIPKPSIRLVQAPVFHGYSFSFWLEFDGEIGRSELEEALASAQIEVRGTDLDAPNNAAAASQSGLLAGDIRLDATNTRAAWLWVAADNLRLVADGVLDILRVLRTHEPI